MYASKQLTISTTPYLSQYNHLWLRLLPLNLTVILFFVQAWIDIGGTTVRSEDVLTLLLFIFLYLLPTITKRVGNSPSISVALNRSLIFWCLLIMFGIILTLFENSFGTATKKDAVVEGFRLILACTLFWSILHHPAPPIKKFQMLVSSVFLFSFITTSVAIMQIGYWDGWLPFSLPSVLTSFKEGANTDLGREIFALYLGNTGTHTWSGMLALQALIVWIIAWERGIKKARWVFLGYFVILVLILIRTSVRNSILGLFITLVFILLASVTYRQSIPVRLIRVIGATSFIAILGTTFLILAPRESYYVQRILQALPQWENGNILISRQSNIFGRLEYGEIAWRIFESSPLLGRGFSSFQELSISYFKVPVVHAHNAYLHTLAELGLVGFIGLLLLIYQVARFLVATRHYSQAPQPYQGAWKLTFGTFIFLLFTSFFSNTLLFSVYFGFFMVLLALLVNLSRHSSQQHEP
ncbi:MAG: O-antigen ligase family protein [Caldilineaceae bacterium]